MHLANTSAIVTGGASGLGAATAAALASQGVIVHAFDLSAPNTDQPGVTFASVDVTNGDDVQQAVDNVVRSGPPLRVVVNCAGIAPSMRILGRKGPHDLGLFAKVIEVNLVGTFTVLTLAAQRIAETSADENGQRGVIINTASIAAFEGQVGQAAYAASKGGIAALTLQAARDLAEFGIRVCTIAPGIVDSPMLATISEEFREGLAASVPFPARLGRPDEYAQLALSIVDHDYLNGETIRMDGALRMAPR